ncbi:MAG: hypothetical protein AAF318_16325 [Pseudomonadota bacterium]
MVRRTLLALSAVAFAAPALAEQAPVPAATVATPTVQTTAEAPQGTKLLRTKAGHAGCSWGAYTPTS